MTRRGGAVAAALVSLASVWLAWPLAFQIDGLSMAPGLLPDDLVRTGMLPVLDRCRRPERFDRWVLVAGDGTRAIKRVVGLPGEAIAILDGDLALGTTPILKGPRLLAEMGSRVPVEEPATPAPESSEWRWALPPREVLDDADFAPQERGRVLLPVRDVGMAGELTVHKLPASGASRVRVRVGDTLVSLALRAAGRYAIVAGRLDGHMVLAAWRLAAATADEPRSCLPPGPPARWAVAIPCAGRANEDVLAPHLALGCAADDATAVVERVAVWRDGLYRPGRDGTDSWRLGADEFLVLGDFPSGSIDGRQWGPMSRTALRQRVSPRAW